LLSSKAHATSLSNERIEIVREIVSYIRVSTEGQHKSGLGEDAQRRALTEFAAQHDLRTAASYSDTASGAAPLTKRPGLAAAILDARKRKCPVVVAKLDRLSRDVHFISGLMAEKVPFVVTQFGLDVDPFMLHIYAAVAQKERALISQRTKEALKGRVLSGKSLRKLTLKTEKAIFDAYVSGTPATQLAQTHGVSRQAITEAVRRYKTVRLESAS
jgi:DNA invertase Pin-like site-specific DNA recombinase